jgi:23S rRNA (adenine2503-C2)-methyltransferase
MAELRTQLERWPIFGGAHMCIEYVLIPGVNDRDQDAHAISDFVIGGESPTSPYPGPRLRAMINVIPYNPRENSPWPAPTQESVDRFMGLIKARGVFVKRRRTKGQDTMAACGQLGSLAYARKKRAAAQAESPRA